MLGKTDLRTAVLLLLETAILFCAVIAQAQHHGGGHGAGGGITGGSSRPSGVDEQDTLKGFHRALAVQATSQQISEFQALLKDAESAKARLQTCIQQQSHSGAGSVTPFRDEEITRSMQQLRADTRKFVDGFSAVQKSGLKEILKKLGEADSNLEADEKRLDESMQAAGRVSTELESRCESVTKS